MGIFDNALEAVSARLGTLTAGSPFGDNALGGANPFSGNALKGGSPFTGPAFGNNTGAFGSNPFGNANSPFGAGPFASGGGSPFGQPFGGGGSPFSGNPYGAIANPYMGTADDPFGTGASSGLPKTSGPGAGSWNGPATADDNKTLTGQTIDNFIAGKFANSPLKGQGAYILQVANQYGISVAVLLGIAWKESGMGTNVAAGNIFGLTDPTRDGGLGNTRAFQDFSGVQAEIEAAARNLASATYRGKSVAEQIGAWYVGPDEYGKLGLQATDKAGNGTVGDYLANFIAPTYQGLGIKYDQNGKAINNGPTVQGASGFAIPGNWEQVAKSFTREGGGWVDYTNGGIRNTGNPKDGMDCSSFVGYVFGLPRDIWTAQAEYNALASKKTTFTNQAQAKKGDLIFFQGTYDTGRGETVTHVGIYLGNGKMLHTGTPGRGVEIVDMNTDYWRQHFYGFGRL